VRSRHHRITLPSGEAVCDSDRHKWPCDAHLFGAALAEVLKLHPRREHPTRSYDLDLRCVQHQSHHPLAAFPYEMVRDCPDCTYREVWYCTRCDHEEWPCPTVQAIIRALTGEENDGG
jgi:hypothetical protein